MNVLVFKLAGDFPASLHHPFFFEGCKAFFGDDKVIQQLNAQHFAGFFEPPGEIDIFLAGLGHIGRVIVSHDKSAGGQLDSWQEHIQRLHHDCVARSPADFPPAQRDIASVDIHGGEVLLNVGAYLLLEKGNRIICALDGGGI